jgi:hypothetical protein
MGVIIEQAAASPSIRIITRWFTALESCSRAAFLSLSCAATSNITPNRNRAPSITPAKETWTTPGRILMERTHARRLSG